MSGQEAHPNVPVGFFTPHHPIPTLPANTDQFVDQLLASPPLHPPHQPMDHDSHASTHPSASATTTMEFTQEKFLQLQALADRQARMLEDGNRFQDEAARKLADSQRQLEETQRNLTDLTTAFNSLSAHGRPLTVTSAPKKKPDLPQFDSKNVLIWIRRVEAAYFRAGVVEPKDKFAWLESMFQIKLDPQIDAFMYGTNTAQDWTDFIEYLKSQYGPTIRQKAQKMMGEIPRNDLKPSQWLLQLKDETKDLELDHLYREHLLKTIPSRIREIMGKEVEDMTSEDVAKIADTFFDRQGRPVEKHSNPVNHVSTASPSTATPPPPSSSTPFTQAFSDDDDNDVNHVRRGRYQGNGGGRFNSRGRSKSRGNFSRAPNASSTASSSSTPQQGKQPTLCRWHRKFGDKALKCATDCSKFKSFSTSSNSGNGQGGRRM